MYVCAHACLVYTCVCVCMFVRLSVCPSVRPSVRLSVRPSVRLSVCLSEARMVSLRVIPAVNLRWNEVGPFLPQLKSHPPSSRMAPKRRFL